MGSVLQHWVQDISFMQQTVLLGAIRGPDGVRKFHPAKPLMKWYRRCVVVSAMDGNPFYDPFSHGGGSFAGPSIAFAEVGLPGIIAHWPKHMVPVVDGYLEARDDLSHHFQMHAMHAFEIVGYRHPEFVIRNFWCETYERIVRAMHLSPEEPNTLHERLGDSLAGWQKHADVSETRGCTVTCSD